MSQELTGKTVLITGASSGIGKATALAVAQAGAAVAVSARRGDRLAELAHAITQAGGRALALASDAADAPQIEKLWHDVNAWAGNKIDAVVVNAGHGLAGSLLTSDQSRWDTMYQLNVLGAARLMRLAAQAMVPRQSGDIIAIGSVVGVHISPFSAFYGSTKFAIVSLAEALRREVARHQVRVSVVKPAIVESEFQAVAGYTPDTFGKAAAQWGKLLVPEDVARAIVFMLAQPPHVHINDLMIRPTGQDYP